MNEIIQQKQKNTIKLAKLYNLGFLVDLLWVEEAKCFGGSDEKYATTS